MVHWFAAGSEHSHAVNAEQCSTGGVALCTRFWSLEHVLAQAVSHVSDALLFISVVLRIETRLFVHCWGPSFVCKVCCVCVVFLCSCRIAALSVQCNAIL